MRKIICSVFLSLSILLSSGCAVKKNVPSVIEGPQVTLDNTKTNIVAIEKEVDNSIKTTKESSTELSKTTSTIREAAISGKLETPEASKQVLNPKWDAILAMTNVLDKIKSNIDKLDEKLSNIKVETKKVETQIDNAKIVSNKQTEDFNAKLEEMTKKYEKEKKARENAEESLHSALKQKLMFLTIIGIAGLGVCVALIFLSPTSAKWGIAGAIGFACVLGVSVILGETLWMMPWIIGIAFGIAFIFIIWRLFIKNRAIRELVETGEANKQVIGELSPKAKNLVYGNGAIRGQADMIQSKSTKDIVRGVRKSVKNAIFGKEKTVENSE